MTGPLYRPLDPRQARRSGAGWYAGLLERSATQGVAGALARRATAAVPDLHHATLRPRFPAGAVPQGWHPEPRVASDLPVPAYTVEAVAHHPDGSLAEAAVTLLLPALTAGEEIVVEFHPRDRAAPQDPAPHWPQHDKAAQPAVTATPLVGYRRADLTAEAAADLPPGEWRRIDRNRHRDVVRPQDGGFDPYYWFPGKTDNPVASTNGIPFAFSSGVLLPDRNLYVFTGGGHGDWLGSEVAVFDYRSQRWHRTEDSARYVVGNTGVGEDQEPDLLDPTAPVAARPHGKRYHYPWPNIWGRHAPLSTHTYAGLSYAPDRGRVYVFGSAGYPGGSAKPGGIWVIDTRDFRWLGAETIAHDGNGFDCYSEYLGDGRLLCYTGQNGQAFIVDVAKGTSAMAAGGKGLRATYGSPSAAVIADPGAAEGRAFLTWASGKSRQLVVARRVDAGGMGAFEPVDGGVPLPEGVDTAASWLALGDHFAGSRTLAVYQPNKGLYALDTATWRWRGPFDQPQTGPEKLPLNKRVWKGFGYLPDYDCFTVVRHDSVWICKRPPELQ
ncbi:hypothetical protein [Caenispirillum bisanense]|uniref:hypothetical protein n=1 Tax=Caenispirillum bisanense TaxID=414052 RepID=UPI0031D40F1A